MKHRWHRTSSTQAVCIQCGLRRRLVRVGGHAFVKHYRIGRAWIERAPACAPLFGPTTGKGVPS